MPHYKNLPVVWCAGERTTDVCFITKTEVCFAVGNYIKILFQDGRETSYQTCVHGISSLSANYKLGLIAFSDCKSSPTIFVVKYPSFQIVSRLRSKRVRKRHLRMTFVGEEFLMTLSGDPAPSVTVWRWSTGRLMHDIPQLLNTKKHRKFRVSLSPSDMYTLCVQQPDSLTFVELDKLGRNLHVDTRVWFPPMTSDLTFSSSVTGKSANDVTVFDQISSGNFGLHSNAVHDLPMTAITKLPIGQMIELVNYLSSNDRLKLGCHCWLSPKELLVGCSNGKVLKIGMENLHTSLFFDVTMTSTKETEVVGITLNSAACFVSNKAGLIFKLRIKNSGVAILLEIIDTATNVVNIMFTPDYINVLVISAKNSLSIFSSEDVDDYHLLRLTETWNSSPVVGICLPYAAHCAVGRRNGQIEIWAIDKGCKVSRFKVRHQLECLEGSPQCSVVFAGTSSGRICLIDVTDLCAPRLLKELWIFDTPVLKIVFENFGRYAFLCSATQGVVILNAMPSSGMPLIGLWRSQNVRDIGTFTRDLETETQIFILQDSIENDFRSEIIVVSLPNDFLKDYRQYWQRNFPVLNDTLWNRKLTIPHQVMSFATHAMYGFFLWSTTKRSIDVSYQDPNSSLLKVQAVIGNSHETGYCKLQLSTTHDWLASFGADGKCFLYELSNLDSTYVRISVQDYQKRGISTVCFPEGRTLVITGGHDGSLACLGFASREQPFMTPWLSHCWSLKHSQNLTIRNIRPERRVETLSWISVISELEYEDDVETMETTKRQVESEIVSIFNKASGLLVKNQSLPSDNRLGIEDLVFDKDLYKKKVALRMKIVLCVKYQLRAKLEFLKQESYRMKMTHVNSMFVKKMFVNSFKEENPVFNFPLFRKSVSDFNQLKRTIRKKQVYGKKQPQKNKTSENFLFDKFDLKMREQKVDQVAVLKNLIRNKKLAFNQKFNELMKSQEVQKQRILEKLARVKFLTKVLKPGEEIFEPDWGCNHFIDVNIADLPEDDKTHSKKLKKTYRKTNVSDKLEESRKMLTEKCNNLVKPRDETEEYILSDMTKPDFMEEVPEAHWTPSETNIAFQFNTKFDAHQKRKQKYMLKVQDELAETKSVVSELINAFDVAHRLLVSERLQSDFFINVKELEIACIYFTTAVDEQFKVWETFIRGMKKESKNKYDMSEDFKVQARKALVVMMWKRAQVLVYDKILQDKIKNLPCERNNYFLLHGIAQNRPELVHLGPSMLDPYASPVVVYDKKKIDKLLKPLDSIDNRPNNVSSSEWEKMCNLRKLKFISEQKLKIYHQQFAMSKSIFTLSMKRQHTSSRELKHYQDWLPQVHANRVLCINDVPLVLEVRYKNLEVGCSDDLSSPYLVMRRDLVDDLSRKCYSEKSMLLTATRDGSKVRTELKISFIRYKRLIIQMQECNRKLKILEHIAMTKELKAVLSGGALDPRIKADALRHTAEYEERELIRLAEGAQDEEKTIEKEVVREVIHYKNMDYRTQRLKEDLAQLKFLCEQG